MLVYVAYGRLIDSTSSQINKAETSVFLHDHLETDERTYLF